jgi:hypothetical protein
MARERAARVRPQHICSTPGRVSRLTDQVKRRGHNALVLRVLAQGRRNRKRVVMKPRRSRPAAEGDTCGPERRPVDTPHRSALARPAIALSAVPNVSSAFSNLAAQQSVNPRVTATGQRPPRSRQTRSQRGLHRRHLQLGEKGGSAVGPTRRVREAQSWRLATAMVFLSPSMWPVLRRMKSPSSTPPSPPLLKELPARLIGDKGRDVVRHTRKP